MATLFEAEQLAKDLMKQHGLQHWNFKFNNAKRAFGKCNQTRKTIYLSAIMTPLRPIERVKNTILHEIAHALVGVHHGHDMVWKRQAMAIGCDGNRVSQDDIQYQAKYLATCDCGYVHKAHRRPKRDHWCKCKGRTFDQTEKLIYVQQF